MACPRCFAALGPEALADAESGATADQIDRVCRPIDGGLSVIAYAPSDALPPTPGAASVRTLLGHLANRTHVVLVTGFPNPDTRLEIMQWADARVLLYEPTLSSLSAAVRSLGAAGCKASDDTGSVSFEDLAEYAVLDPYPICTRRPPSPKSSSPFDGALHAAATGRKIKRPGPRIP